MATFVSLVSFTDQGIRNVRDSPARFDGFRAAARRLVAAAVPQTPLPRSMRKQAGLPMKGPSTSSHDPKIKPKLLRCRFPAIIIITAIAA